MNKISQAEALLFVAGEVGISVSELAQVLQTSPLEAQNLLTLYQDRLDQEESSLQIIQTAGRYKLATRPDFYDLIKQYAQSNYQQKLSQAALEILAIIAYQQPVTRLDIEDIRGVASSGPMQKLLLHGLIKEAGRLDLPGRPKLYETTDEFLNVFGLNSLDDLPDIVSLDDQDEKNILFDSFEMD